MSDSERRTQAAPAKINLGLHVLRKRDDGFHDIQTVFHRVEWSDVVHVEPADRLSMTCSDPDLPTNEHNVCMQAALDLQDAAEVTGGAHIHLEKNVPYGAGLGGGSSDAAATLRLLADLWLDAGEADDRTQAKVQSMLHDVAAGVGSDVPFFLKDVASAYATGRGEVLEPLRAEVGGFALEHPLVVIVPPVQVSTPDAYAKVTPNDAERPDLRAVVTSGDLGRWRQELVNDFSGPIFDAYPEIREARDLMVEMGAAYTSLSGSGSAIYGVFEDETTATAAVRQAAARGYAVGQG